MVALNYKPTNTGSFSETVSFRYNGPDLQKIINVQATVFSPNYLMVENQTGIKNQLNNFSILLKNNEAVRAMQFDVELPLGFDLQPSNLATTARSAGFDVSVSLLSANKYRVLLYSFTNASLNSGTESIINFPVFLNSNLSTGAYSFVYSNVILSNTVNQNISSVALEDGQITVGENLSNTSFELVNILKIFPNPTTDILTVTIPEAFVLEKIEIYNSLGQFVGEYSKNTLSLQNLASGNYHLKIFTSGGNVTKKIIKF